MITPSQMCNDSFAYNNTGSEQPIQWSSEVYDAELALSYYNFRHYNPTDGRWINLYPIQEPVENNLYRFVYNNTLNHIDFLGNVTDPICGSVDSGAGIAIIERQRAAIADGTYPQQAANEEVGWLKDYIIHGIAHAAKKIGTTLIDIAGSDRVPALQGISAGGPGVHFQSPTGGPLTLERLKMLGEVVYELIKLKLDTEWDCHNEGFTKESEKKCLDCCSRLSSRGVSLLTARLIFQGSLLGISAPSALPKTVAMLIAKHEVELAVLAAGSNNCAKNCKKTKCKNDERV